MTKQELNCWKNRLEVLLKDLKKVGFEKTKGSRWKKEITKSRYGVVESARIMLFDKKGRGIYLTILGAFSKNKKDGFMGFEKIKTIYHT